MFIIFAYRSETENIFLSFVDIFVGFMNALAGMPTTLESWLFENGKSLPKGSKEKIDRYIAPTILSTLGLPLLFHFVQSS